MSGAPNPFPRRLDPTGEWHTIQDDPGEYVTLPSIHDPARSIRVWIPSERSLRVSVYHYEQDPLPRDPEEQTSPQSSGQNDEPSFENAASSLDETGTPSSNQSDDSMFMRLVHNPDIGEPILTDLTRACHELGRLTRLTRIRNREYIGQSADFSDSCYDGSISEFDFEFDVDDRSWWRRLLGNIQDVLASLLALVIVIINATRRILRTIR